MPHRPRHHVRAHVLHGIALGAPRQQGAGHQQDKAQAAADRKRTEQHEPAQDRGTDGLEQGRGRRWHCARGQRRAHREHERAAHPMPIDHRDVLPGDGIEAMRHRRQGDRQGRRILLVHSGVIVVQTLALGIEHLDGAEVGGNPLTEPEDHPGRRLLEHSVRLGDCPQEIRMGTHTWASHRGAVVTSPSSITTEKVCHR